MQRLKRINPANASSPLRLRRIAVLAFSSIEKISTLPLFSSSPHSSSTPKPALFPAPNALFWKQIVEHCPQAEIFLLSPLPSPVQTPCHSMRRPFRHTVGLTGQIVHLPEVGQIFEYSISNEFRRFHSTAPPQPPSARCRSESRESFLYGVGTPDSIGILRKRSHPHGLGGRIVHPRRVPQSHGLQRRILLQIRHKQRVCGVCRRRHLLTAAISPGYSRKRPEATALPYRAPAAENTLADSGSKIAGRAVTHSQTGLSQ